MNSFRDLIPSLRCLMPTAAGSAPIRTSRGQYTEFYNRIDAMKLNIARALNAGLDYAVAMELALDVHFTFPTFPLHEIACAKPKVDWLNPTALLMYRFCKRHGLQPFFGRCMAFTHRANMYVKWNKRDIERMLAERASEADEHPQLSPSLPQVRKDYDLDLALLDTSRLYKGVVRIATERGVMIQFRACGRQFEGMALLPEAPAAACETGRAVTIQVVVRRDGEWQIPVLKVVSGDGIEVPAPTEPPLRKPTAPCVRFELTDGLGCDHLQSRVLTGLQLSRCVLIGFGTDGTATPDGKTKGEVTVSGDSQQVAVFTREMSVFGTEIVDSQFSE
ncbi:MAG TPA: hypothetical protein V6D22_17945 [Candidatus Obscuribacterales bacterium]